MSYPVQWLDETFSSRARAQELLRPDLEAGIITEHDYNLATTFLPGFHRHYPYVYGAAATFGTVSYGRLVRTPRWSPQRAATLGFLTYFVGALLGQVQRARQHFRFTQSLENPHAFAQALQNVNVRMGGDKPLPWTLPQAGEVVPATVGSTDVHGDTSQPDEGGSVWASDTVHTTQPDSVLPGAQRAPTTPTQSRPASRWDEIRRVNAGAKPSSWDTIRQRHERAAASNTTSSTDNGAPEANQTNTEYDRAEEQARFDAILEAERKMAGR